METQNKPIDSVVLISGGLDSTVLLHHVVKNLGKHPLALNLFYGQKQKIEMECAKWQCEQLGVPYKSVPLTFFEDIAHASSLTNKAMAVPALDQVLGHPQPSTYVPNRNGMFVMIAAAYAEAFGGNQVFYGIQRADLYNYFDTVEEARAGLEAYLQLNRLHRIAVKAPLLNNKKAENIKWGIDLGVDFSKTWSCYSPVEKDGRVFAEGQCATCRERVKGFAENGLSDPLLYLP